MYILLAQRRHFLKNEKKKRKKKSKADYVQVYLFIILYSYWIATNIIQYILYLLVLVYEYLSVCIRLYPRKWGQLLYQRIIPFFRNTRTFHGGGGVLAYLGMVGRFCGDDPHFCNCQSNLDPIVWYNQIWMTPSFCQNNQFVSTTLSSRYMDIYLVSILHQFSIQLTPFSSVLDLIDLSIFYRVPNLQTENLVSTPPPRPFTQYYVCTFTWQ